MSALIRLQGIDAPERKQPYGRTSGRSLSALVAGKQVRVEYDKRDRYGRIIGVVWVRSPDTRCDAEPCPMTLDAGMYQLLHQLAYGGASFKCIIGRQKNSVLCFPFLANSRHAGTSLQAVQVVSPRLHHAFTRIC